MDKKIPVFFDEAIIINSPIQEIVNEEKSTISRLKVGAFYKYKNRNGSYITDEYAELLIKSATRGNVPVVGFFDPGEQAWASHTGPTLANGYGYVESFLGWEPFTDTDGITREYAVFSVILFTDYYEEARKVLGQNQSMELDINTIDGDWARFDDEEYFVYTKGDMASFCIIGAHEPCFSVSSFFEKNDDIYKSQYEKFSSLLSDLKTIVEEAEQNNKGGEQPMNEFENQEVVEQVQEEETVVEEVVQEETQNEVETEVEAGSAAEPNEFEVLQQKYNDLENQYNALVTEHQETQNQYEALTEQINTLNAQIEQLQSSVSAYELQAQEIENNRKNELVNKYEKLVSEEEIEDVRANINNFSYEALESKLAISFANKQLSKTESEQKVPLHQEEESPFASLMKKYRK